MVGMETRNLMSKRSVKIARNPRGRKSLRDVNQEAAGAEEEEEVVAGPRAPVTTIEVAANTITLNPVRAATVLTTVIRIINIQTREITETPGTPDTETSRETPVTTTSPDTDHDARHTRLVRAGAGGAWV